MQAILLAGGLGTRLRPLTDGIPKPLVPVSNRPLIEHLVCNLREAGITDIVISAGFRGKQLEAALGDGRRLDVHLTYAHEPEPLGTGGAIRYAGLQLKPEPFLVLNADIVADFNIPHFLARHREGGAAAVLALVEVDDPSSYGVVELDETHRIHRFVEKPAIDKAPSRWINAGCYVLSPAVLDTIPDGRPVSVEREVFPHLIEEGATVLGVIHAGYWVDTGTPDRYLALHRDVLDGRAPFHALQEMGASSGLAVAASARVHPTATLRAPVLLAEDCVVEGGAVVGPYVVAGARTQIGEHAEIVDSVLWNEVRVTAGARVEGSIVGFGAVASGSLRAALISPAGTGSVAGTGSMADAEHAARKDPKGLDPKKPLEGTAKPWADNLVSYT